MRSLVLCTLMVCAVSAQEVCQPPKCTAGGIWRIVVEHDQLRRQQFDQVFGFIVRYTWRCSVGLFKFTPERAVFANVQDKDLEEIRTFFRQRTGAILPEGDAATVDMNGWDVTWSYNRPAQELTIIVNSKPKWPPMKFVRSAIRDELARRGIAEVAK